MRHPARFFIVAVVALLVLMARTTWAQQTTSQPPQTTTTTEMKQFEVVSVNGDKVVVKDQAGNARELTVPPDFKMTVDGREVTVADLKPGMLGTATITTTTRSIPVYVTELKSAEVINVAGDSMTVRTPNGYRMFTPADLKKHQTTLQKDGQPIEFAAVRKGDRVTAVIVTEGPPATVTERQVQATMSTPPPQEKPAVQPPPPPPPTPKPEPAQEPTPEPQKNLPKTASDRPLVGVLGAVSLAMAVLLATRRRRSALQ